MQKSWYKCTRETGREQTKDKLHSHDSRISKPKGVKVPYMSVSISFFSSAPPTKKKKKIHFSPSRQDRWYPWKGSPLSTIFFFRYQKNGFRSLSINPVTNYMKKGSWQKPVHGLSMRKGYKIGVLTVEKATGRYYTLHGLEGYIRCRKNREALTTIAIFLQKQLALHWKAEGKIS